MSWKRLFARSLADNPRHFAAHSHHLWPDASRDGQRAAWDDAERLADRKWGRVMGEIWPEAQGHVARELNLPDPATVVFAPNTHDLLVRIVSAIDARPVRIATTAHEFHSFRRQAARWAEAGTASTTLDLAGDCDLIWASHVAFATGAVRDDLAALADRGREGRPLVAIDGYHAFMAIPVDLAAIADRIFYLGGGYKYAMAGEGVGFAHCPPGRALRPAVTGWYAEFEDLSLSPGRVGYAPDARRMLGATFDPSGLYRFNSVQRMLAAEGLTTATISAHVAALQARLLDAVGDRLGEVLNPLVEGQREHARFLAFRSPRAPAIQRALAERGVTTDVRGDILRIGFGLYHEASDVDALVAILEGVLA